jgi:hypothetical protein
MSPSPSFSIHMAVLVILACLSFFLMCGLRGSAPPSGKARLVLTLLAVLSLLYFVLPLLTPLLSAKARWAFYVFRIFLGGAIVGSTLTLAFLGELRVLVRWIGLRTQSANLTVRRDSGGTDNLGPQ